MNESGEEGEREESCCGVVWCGVGALLDAVFLCWGMIAQEGRNGHLWWPKTTLAPHPNERYIEAPKAEPCSN